MIIKLLIFDRDVILMFLEYGKDSFKNLIFELCYNIIWCIIWLLLLIYSILNSKNSIYLTVTVILLVMNIICTIIIGRHLHEKIEEIEE